MSQTNNIKYIPSYEGLYGVTPNGEVFSFIRNKFLKQFYNQFGRPKVDLRKEGKTKQFYVHRLVYETWVGEVPKGLDVDHIDGDKTNSKLSNLRLLTRSENMLEFYNIHGTINLQRSV